MNMRTLAPEDYWRAIVSRKGLVISAILTSLSLAIGICVWMPKSYRSFARLWVEGPKIEESMVRTKGDEGPPGDSAEMQRLMQARQFLMGRDLLKRVAAEFTLYGYDKERPESVASEGAVRAVRGNVKLELSKDKLFYLISYANENPRLAKDVTARLSELFVELNLQEREQGVEAAEEFLQQELILAKAELEAKEKLIAQFKQEHLGELPQQMEANLRTLDRLQAERKSQNEMAQSLNDRLASLNKAIRLYEETGETSDSSGSAQRRTPDPRLSRIKDLERQLVQLSAIYKDTYPDIVQISEEIRRLKEMSTAQYRELLPESEDVATLGGERKGKGRFIDAYHKELLKQREEILLDLEAVKRRQARISGEMAQYEARVERTPAREQKLMTLVRDYENMQKNYQSLLDKKLNAGIAGNLQKRRVGSKYSIVDPASRPFLPEVPNIPLVMFAGLGLGCALGFGGAIALEILGRGFRTPEDVEVALGLPVIASIPLYESVFGGAIKPSKSLLNRHRSQVMLPPPVEGRGRKITPSSGLLATGNGSQEGRHTQPSNLTPGLELVSMWRPMSFVAEQYRVAATRFELMSGERKSTVVVVTSAVMGEGKSSTAVNLGYVLAKDLDRRTLVIDCDFKRPSQHIYAGVWQHPGLADALRGTKLVDDCLQRVGDHGPWILPSGSVADTPLALSRMHRIADLIAELRQRYDYIIVDAPPVLPLADMHVLASMGDILAYVIRANATGRDVVQKGLRALGETGNVGVILNGLDEYTTPYYMQQEYYREARHEQLK